MDKRGSDRDRHPRRCSDLVLIQPDRLLALVNFDRVLPGRCVLQVGMEVGTECRFSETRINKGSAVIAGGQGGIRTHGGFAPTPDFESGTFDHSATCPVNTEITFQQRRSRRF